MIHRVPFFLPWLYPNLVWRIPTSEKELFLTFDDGPVPGVTDFVLQTLKKYSCKATFFCIGENVQKHPAVFKKVVEDGHTIGNHTFNHVKGWSTSLSKYIDNIKQCDNILHNSKFEIQDSEFIAKDSGFSTQGSRLFRPPYGRITRKQIKALSNYKIILWDVLTIDYNKNVSPESCLRNSIGATRPGSIIVFHDSLKAERNMMYALPRYIEYFHEQGFVFKALPS
jgi:peptidoglycan/xylan/chitin deacetylase (PgdA/CDA1 family)